METQEKKLTWRDPLRGGASFGLHPAMLKAEGYTNYSAISVKGELPGINSKIRAFLFDREYVYHFIITKIIKALYITSYRDLETIIQQAWNAYEKSKETD